MRLVIFICTLIVYSEVVIACTSRYSNGTCVSCSSPSTQYGLYCLPCHCVNGICSGDLNGTGYCRSCSGSWRGSKCDRSLSYAQFALDWAEAYSCAVLLGMVILVVWVWIAAAATISEEHKDDHKNDRSAANDDDYNEPGIVYYESNTDPRNEPQTNNNDAQQRQNRPATATTTDPNRSGQDRGRPQQQDGSRSTPAVESPPWYQTRSHSEQAQQQQQPNPQRQDRSVGQQSNEPTYEEGGSPPQARASPKRHPPAAFEESRDAVSHGRGPARANNEPSRFSRGATAENGPLVDPPHQVIDAGSRSSPQRQRNNWQSPSQQNPEAIQSPQPQPTRFQSYQESRRRDSPRNSGW